MEPRAALPVDTRDLLTAWLDGDLVRDIAERLGVDDAQDVTEYIEDAFNYRLPWGTSGYLRIASEATDVPATSTLAANIAGMIKYGVPMPEAVWALTAGVASRRAAMAVADDYLRFDRDRTVRDFKRWLGRLDPDSVAERLGLTGAELESTARAILRSQPNEYLAALDRGESLLPLRTTARPVRSAIDTGLAYEVSEGMTLAAERDLDSRLNRNAVALTLGSQRFGYLQADAARALGAEMDAGLTVAADVVEVRTVEGRVQEVTVELRELAPSEN